MKLVFKRIKTGRNAAYNQAENKLFCICKNFIKVPITHKVLTFTSVPVDPVLGIIKGILEQDNTLKERTVLPVMDRILLLAFCPHNIYLSFQGQFYEQVEGATMGSPVSPIVANLYMEYFEQKAPNSATHPQAMAEVCG